MTIDYTTITEEEFEEAWEEQKDILEKYGHNSYSNQGNKENFYERKTRRRIKFKIE